MSRKLLQFSLFLAAFLSLYSSPSSAGLTVFGGRDDRDSKLARPQHLAPEIRKLSWTASKEFERPGWPVCTDVFKEMEEKGIEPAIRERKEAPIETELKLEADRPYENRSYCFADETPIVRLNLRTQDIEEVTVDDIEEGDYVLGSTVNYTDNPAWQTDCWTQVRTRWTGEIKHGDFTVVIRAVSGQNPSTYFESSPKHPYWAKLPNETEPRWITADRLVAGTKLMHTCAPNADSCEVLQTNRKIWNNMFLWGLIAGDGPDVVTFTTDCSGFYVGREATRVFVHNKLF